MNLRAICDAGPVSRILYGVAAVDGHSSRPAITGKLKRPTRKCGAPGRHALGAACAVPNSFPIWSCSVWGLPCPGHYCPGGALLPHLFTLTASLDVISEGSATAFRLLRPRVRLERDSSRRSLTCGGMFSVALSVEQVSSCPPGRYPAHCPAEFGLSSLLPRSLAREHPTTRSACRGPVRRAFAPRRRPSSPASAIHIIDRSRTPRDEENRRDQFKPYLMRYTVHNFWLLFTQAIVMMSPQHQVAFPAFKYRVVA